MRSIKWHLWETVFRQTSYSNGFSPVCVCMWTVKFCCVKRFSDRFDPRIAFLMYANMCMCAVKLKLRDFSRVCSNVDSEIVALIESFQTDFTLEWFFSCIYSCVLRCTGAISKNFQRNFKLVRFISHMKSHVLTIKQLMSKNFF